MKIIIGFLFGALFVSSNGCMTYTAIQESEGHQSKVRWISKKQSDDKCHPGWYFLVPITVPSDIATAPISFMCLYMFTDGFDQF